MYTKRIPRKDVTPEARQVFEQLTGWEYEKAWGNNKIGYENLINYQKNHNKTKHKTAV